MKSPFERKKADPKQKQNKNPVTEDRDEVVDNQEVCHKAPEWAEHQRLWDDDEPCDDGRSGRLEDE